MIKEKKLCQQEILGIFRSRTETFLIALELCYRAPEEKNVHDLRVSARRLHAILQLLWEIKDYENIKKVNRKTKRVLGIFADLRDIQVQQLLLKDLITQFPELENFIDQLENREKKEVFHCNKELESLDQKQLKEDLIRLNKKVEGNLKKKEIPRILKDLIQKDYHRVMDSKDALTLDDVNTFHRLRIDCKKFRYRMEIVEPLLVSKLQVGEAFKNIQDKLGEIQDLTVLLTEVKKYPELCTEASTDEEFSLWLTERLQEKMRLFYREAEDLFDVFTEHPLFLTKNNDKAVIKMGEKNKSEKLCKLVKKDYLDENLKEYIKLVGEPKFLCKNCGRAAEKEKQLCKAKKLK